jgi:hypothetical protein
MATSFWDRKFVMIVEFVQQGTIITSEVYCETLKERRGMLTSNVLVVFLHENVRSLALEHRWSISTGSCLTTLLKGLNSLRVTTTCLST